MTPGTPQSTPEERAVKARENRLRRAARRLGFNLRKLRAYRPHDDTWFVEDLRDNAIVAGPLEDLDAVEDWLLDRERRS